MCATRARQGQNVVAWVTELNSRRLSDALRDAVQAIAVGVDMGASVEADWAQDGSTGCRVLRALVDPQRRRMLTVVEVQGFSDVDLLAPPDLLLFVAVDGLEPTGAASRQMDMVSAVMRKHSAVQTCMLAFGNNEARLRGAARDRLGIQRVEVLPSTGSSASALVACFSKALQSAVAPPPSAARSKKISAEAAPSAPTEAAAENATGGRRGGGVGGVCGASAPRRRPAAVRGGGAGARRSRRSGRMRRVEVVVVGGLDIQLAISRVCVGTAADEHNRNVRAALDGWTTETSWPTAALEDRRYHKLSCELLLTQGSFRGERVHVTFIGVRELAGSLLDDDTVRECLPDNVAPDALVWFVSRKTGAGPPGHSGGGSSSTSAVNEFSSDMVRNLLFGQALHRVPHAPGMLVLVNDDDAQEENEQEQDQENAELVSTMRHIAKYDPRVVSWMMECSSRPPAAAASPPGLLEVLEAVVSLALAKQVAEEQANALCGERPPFSLPERELKAFEQRGSGSPSRAILLQKLELDFAHAVQCKAEYLRGEPWCQAFRTHLARAWQQP